MILHGEVKGSTHKNIRNIVWFIKEEKKITHRKKVSLFSYSSLCNLKVQRFFPSLYFSIFYCSYYITFSKKRWSMILRSILCVSLILNHLLVKPM